MTRRTYQSVQAQQNLARRLARLEADYRAGRAHAQPARITAHLDLAGLHGPSVDRACLAEEPAVDQWEAGTAAPTWEQLCALAALCGVTPEFLCREQPPPAAPVYLCGDHGCELTAPRPAVPPYRPARPARPLRAL